MALSGIRSPLEFRVFDVNGAALHVVLAGPASGKPLVFLHGFSEFWFGWRHLIPDLRWLVGGGFAIVFLLLMWTRAILFG
jgi:pimeloyl-ACP methyl ester carboxylesterase